jgi:vacuolar-type H+-ATPase subunit H
MEAVGGDLSETPSSFQTARVIAELDNVPTLGAPDLARVISVERVVPYDVPAIDPRIEDAQSRAIHRGRRRALGPDPNVLNRAAFEHPAKMAFSIPFLSNRQRRPDADRRQRAEEIPPRFGQAARRADEVTRDTLDDVRKIAPSVHEAARDKARAVAKTEAYAVSCRERKKVEMLFAHLKRILRLGRLRLRGPSEAKDEFLLARSTMSASRRLR